MKKASWIVVAFLSVCIGLYPIIYFVIDGNFGLLRSKPEALLNDLIWNIGFHGHIVFGGISLLVGWLQFSSSLREKKIGIHRLIGKIYVGAVLISGACGIYIAFFATGGIVSILGFLLLGIIWTSTTLLGYRSVVMQKDIRNHEKWMIYSYAACFAAVTLRIWLPALTSVIGAFTPAYRIVAWLCWVPNIIVAYFIVHSRKALRTKL